MHTFPETWKEHSPLDSLQEMWPRRHFDAGLPEVENTPEPEFVEIRYSSHRRSSG